MKGTEIKPVKNPKTVAKAIECGEPIDGRRVLKIVKESGGFMESVTDRDILKARETLASREGLFAEPAGAAAMAGVLKVRRLPRGSRVVCLITGHGLKVPHTGVSGKPVEIRPDFKALKRVFR